MSELLSTQEAANLLGVTKGTFSNSLSKWELRHIKRTRNSAFFHPADVERVKAERDKAAQERKARQRANPPKAKRKSTGTTDRLNTDETSLTTGEMAVVYDAWLKHTLGNSSPWRGTTPPPTYKLAWEAREAAREDAAEWELAA